MVLVQTARPYEFGKRDRRIDWLRGLAMTCVIVNHSKLSSLLSWFSYERLWVVTAAEVFVVLSGIVLGMVYGRRLVRDGWRAVVHGLGRRAALLYAVFVGVTVSLMALSALGVDVRPVTISSEHPTAWTVTADAVTVAPWRDVLMMRAGPWTFEIIGLYVWLVAAAAPCLLLLHYAGWRTLLAASWTLYLWYRFDPRVLTHGGFEFAFPLLAWQLLFVHGIAIGYHRDAVAAFAGRLPRSLPRAAMILTAAFTLFAFCNPWTDGPSWLHLGLISPEAFASAYERFFTLSELRVGRLLNLTIALPLAHVMLTRHWGLLRPLETLFVTLGQRSLGAFVLHVYGLLLLAHVRIADGLLINTIVQVALVVAIAALLNGTQILRSARRPQAPPARVERLAA